MKFLSPSSPAASTTTTTTTNSKSNSYIQKSISSRGVIGILGRLLCFNTLPMHPPDQSREISKEAKECGVLDYGKQVNFEAMGNPGIEVGLGGTQTRPNSITRSHSTNYADTVRLDKPRVRGKVRRPCRVKKGGRPRWSRLHFEREIVYERKPNLGFL